MQKKLSIVIVVVLSAVILYFLKSSLTAPEIVTPQTENSDPNQVGEPVPGSGEAAQAAAGESAAVGLGDGGAAGKEDGDTGPVSTESQPLVIPAAVITSLNQCFQTGVQTALADLGEASESRERWLDYSLKMPDGKERRVHVENFEEDSGKLRSSLVVYDIDNAGEPVPVNIDARDQENPTSDVVQNYLNQGVIKAKERSVLSQYAGGLKVETVEKQGRVNEIEFEKDGQFFRCDQVDKVGTCFCSK
jgi:hypothetical protein